jgi:hypothetical protein
MTLKAEVQKEWAGTRPGIGEASLDPFYARSSKIVPADGRN